MRYIYKLNRPAVYFSIESHQLFFFALQPNMAERRDKCIEIGLIAGARIYNYFVSLFMPWNSWISNGRKKKRKTIWNYVCVWERVRGWEAKGEREKARKNEKVPSEEYGKEPTTSTSTSTDTHSPRMLVIFFCSSYLSLSHLLAISMSAMFFLFFMFFYIFYRLPASLLAHLLGIRSAILRWCACVCMFCFFRCCLSRCHYWCYGCCCCCCRCFVVVFVIVVSYK